MYATQYFAQDLMVFALLLHLIQMSIGMSIFQKS